MYLFKILWMEEILHQLIDYLSISHVNHIIYSVSFDLQLPTGAGFLSIQNSFLIGQPYRNGAFEDSLPPFSALPPGRSKAGSSHLTVEVTWHPMRFGLMFLLTAEPESQFLLNFTLNENATSGDLWRSPKMLRHCFSLKWPRHAQT